MNFCFHYGMNKCCYFMRKKFVVSNKGVLARHVKQISCEFQYLRFHFSIIFLNHIIIYLRLYKQLYAYKDYNYA